jgi:hypothetical protein
MEISVPLSLAKLLGQPVSEMVVPETAGLSVLLSLAESLERSVPLSPATLPVSEVAVFETAGLSVPPWLAELLERSVPLSPATPLGLQVSEVVVPRAAGLSALAESWPVSLPPESLESDSVSLLVSRLDSISEDTCGRGSKTPSMKC